MKYDLIIETEKGFNLYKFFLEFKQLQSKGHFQKVKTILKLEHGEELEITKKNDEFFVNPEDYDKYGINEI